MNQVKSEIKSLKSIFRAFPQVKLAYLFGSAAKEEIGPLSDYDFAVYLNEKDPKKRFTIRLKLLNRLIQKLKTEKITLQFGQIQNL